VEEIPKPTEQEKALSWLEPLNRVDNEALNTDTLAKKYFQIFWYLGLFAVAAQSGSEPIVFARTAFGHNR
jgi:hypothetical protein